MVGASLAGIAAEVRLLDLRGLLENGDVSDWLDAGEREERTAGEMRHELERLAAAATAARRQGGTALEPGDPVEAALAGLAATAGAETAGEWLRRLGDALRGADELRRSLARERAMAALRGKMKAPARCVNAALAIRQPPTAGRGGAVELAVPELWPRAVDGATLLGDLAATFARFVALPHLADAAAALWTVHAHALEAAGASPLLALTSSEKRCGKTTTLALLSRLVLRPLLSSNITVASLFRVVDKYSPTLLADEADSFLRDKEELRGILNSGHTRDAAYVVRTVARRHPGGVPQARRGPDLHRGAAGRAARAGGPAVGRVAARPGHVRGPAGRSTHAVRRPAPAVPRRREVRPRLLRRGLRGCFCPLPPRGVVAAVTSQ